VIPVAVMVLVVGLLASLALTPAVSWLATRQGWLDRPDGQRKLHAEPVPRIGGLSVYASFAIALGVLVLWVPQAAASDGIGVNRYAHLLLAGGAVAIIGLVDDLVGVSPWAKVFVQALAATYLYFHGFQIRALTNPFGEPIWLGHLALPLTILWFVGMSNAINLIDGLDGLAAGVAFLATTSLFAAAALNEHWATGFMAAALGGALLGFLRYNFNPASVFLGDCGSLFVGFALAAFAITGSMKTSAAIAVAAPLLALALPIFDVMVSLLRRMVRGTGLFAADSDHIHHRLLRFGLTPRRTVVLLYGVAALLASLSLATLAGPQQVLWAVGIVFVLVVWVGLNRLGYAELGELQRLLLRRLVPDRRTMANNVSLLRLRETLIQADSFAAAWDELIVTARLLDCRKVEMQLKPEFSRRLPQALRAAPPRSPFPCWRGDGTEADPRWSWTIPLAGSHDVIGALVMDFDPGAEALGFEPSHLLEAVTKGFASAARRLLVDSETHGLPPRDRSAKARSELVKGLGQP
jgi:UDP-GlcNAc:undecaprenyl-phosphate GlcNAc-1-phosphate transferase